MTLRVVKNLPPIVRQVDVVAAYVRVSSRSQNAATQRDAIAVAARARGDAIAEFFEEKRSASRIDRAELANVREAARQGQIQKLYVFRIDRLTRTGIRDTLGLIDELKRNGCAVVSVADGFDLEGPAAEIVLAVMAWAAQMERLAIGERISAARARVEASGGSWGRPRRVTPELEQAIVKMRRSGTEVPSIRDIAVALKVPRSTVAAVLSEKGPYGRVVPRPTEAAPRKR